MAGRRFLPLKLRAEDVEDVTVLSACLQDATVRAADMTWQPKQRRFALVLNRFSWEDERNADAKRRLIRIDPHIRVAAGLHFRSAERREGKECVSTCSSRWSPTS